MPLIEKEIYTIHGFYDSKRIYIKERPHGPEDSYVYYTWRFRKLDDSFGSQVASEIESEMHQLDELIERRLEEIEQLKYK